MVMGISAIMNMVNMPTVIFAVVIGTIIGLLLKFRNLINKGAGLMEKGLVQGYAKQENQTGSR